ncbi:MAG: DNA primase, partial [Eubacterium sp.]|nr:DNA primase [Eubacterium sp.]
VEACRMKDTVEYLADVLTVGSLEVRVAAVKDLMADGRIGALEEKVRRARTEEGGDEGYGKE